MDNRQIVRHIESFKKIRKGWIDILVGNPDDATAVSHIMSINAKIELLRVLWNFSEEGEMP